MRRINRKTFSILCFLVFFFSFDIYPLELMPHNGLPLSPPLRTCDELFREFYAAASICRFIESQGKLDEYSYLDNVLLWAREVNMAFSGVEVLASRHEIIIELLRDGMAVRYFDPGEADIIPRFSDMKRTRTKVINKRLWRQVLYRAKSIEG